LRNRGTFKHGVEAVKVAYFPSRGNDSSGPGFARQHPYRRRSQGDGHELGIGVTVHLLTSTIATQLLLRETLGVKAATAKRSSMERLIGFRPRNLDKLATTGDATLFGGVLRQASESICA
jgi:hypothetical protein